MSVYFNAVSVAVSKRGVGRRQNEDEEYTGNFIKRTKPLTKLSIALTTTDLENRNHRQINTEAS